MKILTFWMRNTTGKINSRMEAAKERISELEGQVKENRETKEKSET